jgi:hypothetical protein
MFGRKGQGAMEYLMTYGWAILVVMIVGIVMWQLGIFNMGGTTMTASGFAKLKPQLGAMGVTGGGGGFQGVFTNGVGTRINVLHASVVGTFAGGGAGCSTFTVDPTNPAAGDNFLISATTCTSAAQSGEVYVLTLSIPYEVMIGAITTTHTDTGVVRGPAE